MENTDNNILEKEAKMVQSLTFLDWFQAEYVKRREKNSSYSIRAFSNYLGLASGTVSHLLSGKRSPSKQYAENIITTIGANPQERDMILESLGKAEIKQATMTNFENYQQLSMDAFKMMADWYHYAILEMMYLEDFRYDYKWMANQLDISVTETRQAVDRLVRLELIEIKEDSLVRSESFFTNGDDVLTSAAHKKLQKHVLKMALNAIDNVEISKKDISSMTMAIDPKKIPEAKKKITEFRRSLCAFLENGERTQVYNLGIQIYPISKQKN